MTTQISVPWCRKDMPQLRPHPVGSQDRHRWDTMLFPLPSVMKGREGKSLSPVQLFVTPRTIWSMEFSRPEYWSGEPFPSPADLTNPGIKLGSPTLQVDSFPAEPSGKHPSQQSAFRKSVPLRAPMRLAAASLLLISISPSSGFVLL